MKRTAAVLLASAALTVGVGAGCEPAMTITAVKPAGADHMWCGTVFKVKGTVTPATATPRVVLQETRGGKWRDVIAYGSIAEIEQQDPSMRVSKVDRDTGAYSITVLYAPVTGGAQFTWHLRVRSDKSAAVSNSFYVVYEPIDTCVY